MENDDLNIERLQKDVSLYKSIIKEQEMQIRNLNAKLKASESAKSHFLSNVRNELVNPFASVHSLAKIVLSLEEENWSKVVSFVTMIHKEAFFLDFQLVNIFAAAELESGEVSINKYRAYAASFFNDLISDYQIYAKRKGVILEFKYIVEDNLISIDIEKVQLMTSNLIMNAISHSNPGDTINVEWLLEDDHLVIRVKDTGPGISIDKQKDIYNRFSRGNTEINSINTGLGLGLSIVYGYIELLNGKINFTSSQEGTMFELRTPYAIDENNDIAIASNEFLFDNDADEIF